MNNKLIYKINNLEINDKNLLDNYNYFLHTLLPNNIDIFSLYYIDNNIIEYVKIHYYEMRFLLFIAYKHSWYKKKLYIINNKIVCKFFDKNNYYDYLTDEEIYKNIFYESLYEINNKSIYIPKLNLSYTFESFAYIYLHVIKIITDYNINYLFILGILEACIELNVVSIPFLQKKPYGINFIYNFNFDKIELKSLYVINQIKIFAAWKNESNILITGDTGIGKTSQIPKLFWWINFLYDGYKYPINFNKFEFNLLLIKKNNIVSRSTILSLPRKVLVTENSLNIAKSLGFRHIYNSPINCIFKDVKISQYYNKNSKNFISDFILSINRVTKFDLVNTLIFDEVHEHDTYADINITKAKFLKKKNNIRCIVLISATVDDDMDILNEFFPDLILIHIPGNTLYPIKEIYSNESIEKIILKYSKNIGKKTIIFLPSVSSINNLYNNLIKILNHDIYTIYTLYRQILLEKDILKEIENITNKHIIIISSPVAESSLTIKNAEVVIDYGLFYCKKFFSGSIMNITNSMMKQRKGRIGRLSEGTYIRLFELDKLTKNFKKIDYEFLFPYIINCIYYNINFTDLFIKPTDMTRFDKTINYFMSKNINIKTDINKIYNLYNTYNCNIPEYIIVYLQNNNEMNKLISLFNDENNDNKKKLILSNKILFLEMSKLINIKVKIHKNKTYIYDYYENILPLITELLNVSNSENCYLISENICIS